jgi:hypothetical protein
MFVSRTVAAEVCMEAKSNDIGYTALKLLDKSGHLRFELSYVLPKFVVMLLFMWYIRVLVEDLLQVLALILH